MIVFLFLKKKFVKNTNLFCNYKIISSLFNQLGLVIKHNKLEVFHFSRSIKNAYLPPLDLKPLGSLLLHPKYTWQYLEFFFNKKLSFH